MEMKIITDYLLQPSEAALWWLGQAGYILKSGGKIIVIDPYLSDSASGGVAGFSRAFAAPLLPESLNADVYIITHDHLDHLDPVTIRAYPRKTETWFIAPRLAAKKLPGLGVPEERILVVNAGESVTVDSVTVTGVFALPTGKDVIDTTGYLIEFSNGRTVYHTSDTQFHPLVLDAAPSKPDVMLVPINGKWKNTNAEEAVLFAKAVSPGYVMPNHYDLMPLNAENPEVFEWFCHHHRLLSKPVIPKHFKPFTWDI
ncbi:MBL fold metallo-hydrolase [Parafilimonas terrae]|uniref:L-ascorbate 6-phosphate lactonase n=1 Tax=Parafilimonas terrae TaxID=1465490 RepID=A0A1I5Y0Y1_9BACT|nr:MBL fold metallo-hydrolase [Parafilimonas terrae]SFQ37859.1 L-ascorbate 6-phosphate lactonase [Parafilimonas terrae]